MLEHYLGLESSLVYVHLARSLWSSGHGPRYAPVVYGISNQLTWRSSPSRIASTDKTGSIFVTSSCKTPRTLPQRLRRNRMQKTLMRPLRFITSRPIPPAKPWVKELWCSTINTNFSGFKHAPFSTRLRKAGVYRTPLLDLSGNGPHFHESSYVFSY